MFISMDDRWLSTHTVRAAVVVTFMLILASCFVGCGGSPNTQQGSASQSSEASSPSTEASSSSSSVASDKGEGVIPDGETTFITGYFDASATDAYTNIIALDGPNACKPVLHCTDGSVLFSDKSEYSFLGPLREGKVFVSWVTSDYDEKWHEETNKVRHFGMMNEKGEIEFELTDLMLDCAGGKDRAVSYVSKDCHYQDGYAYIQYSTTGSATSKEFMIIDEKGGLILSCKDFADGGKLAGYTMGSEKGVVYSAPEFDHALTASGNIPLYPNLNLLNPKTGEIVVSVDQDPLVFHLSAAGQGYTDSYAFSYGSNHGRTESDKVYKLDGTVAFDADSLKGGEYDSVNISGYSRDNDGTIGVVCSKKFDTKVKSMYGIYDFVNKKWVIEPSMDTGEYVSGFDHGYAQRYVAAGKLGLVDAKGDVVFSSFPSVGKEQAHYYDGDWWMIGTNLFNVKTKKTVGFAS